MSIGVPVKKSAAISLGLLLVSLLPGTTLAGQASGHAWISEQIYRNECAAKPENLVHWNRGEDFPSLGIGHFIWYPVGSSGVYVEQFPQLMAFLLLEGIALPEYVQQALADGGAPWPNREAFLAARQTPEVLELQRLLEQTRELQFAFIRQRFEQQLPKLLAAAGDRQAELEQKAAELLALPTGSYPLIDYVNFKGAGTSPAERYQDQGWGLLQVLALMQANTDDPLLAFALAADAVLTQRVALAPQARGESRWLAGWRARLATYH